MSDKKEEPCHSLGKTALLLGGGAMLAVSAIDGTALVLAGSAALGYCSWWAVNSFLVPEDLDKKGDKKGKVTDKMTRDLGVIKYVVAGACAFATFMNPFIGVPGTAILIIMWNGWQKETKEFLKKTKDKVKETAKKTVDYSAAMGSTSW